MSPSITSKYKIFRKFWLMLMLATLAALFLPQSASAQFLQQGAKIVGTGGAGNGFDQGYSLAISADGNTAVVGGFVDDTGKGAAWIFTRSNGVWSQQGDKLFGTGGVGVALQGCSVSLSADGNTVAIGGYRDNSFVGAVWVFVRNAGVWSQQGAKLFPTGAVGASSFGSSVRSRQTAIHSS